jgi:hypothetical protein
MASFLHLFDPHTGHALAFAITYAMHINKVDVESGGQNGMGLNIIKYCTYIKDTWQMGLHFILCLFD